MNNDQLPSVFDLLKSEGRDYVVDHAGKHVSVDSLKKDGSYLALYFSAHWCPPCRGFTPKLAETYKALQAQQKPFEVIFVSSDSDENQFKEYFASMPWLALPYSDRASKESLSDIFQVEGIPTLIVFNSQGQIVGPDARNTVARFGVKGFPFTEAREKELLLEKEKEMKELRLKDLLTTSSRDYVLNKKEHVPVSSLANKVVGLYFSAHWCGPCRAFTPELAKAYNELKQQGKPFEIVFVSSDQGQEAFDEYYGSMPWLGLPFEDRQTKDHLSDLFEIQGIPSLVLFGADGSMLTKSARGVLAQYGAKAFPFTEEKLAELRAVEEARFATMPKQVTDPRHPHPLTLMPKVYGGMYGCDGCAKGGSGYAYHCDECGFDLHPDCAQGDKH